MGNTTTAHAHTDKTQAAKILARIAHGNSINPVQALRLFGCFRLGARIYELRKMGVNVASRRVKFTGQDGKSGHYSAYWLRGTLDELPEAAKQMLNLQTATQ